MTTHHPTNAPVAPIQPIAMSSAQELWLVDIILPTTTSATPAAVVGGITVWPAPAPLLKYIDHTKTKIRRAQRILCALDDREGWQRDLVGGRSTTIILQAMNKRPSTGGRIDGGKHSGTFTALHSPRGGNEHEAGMNLAVIFSEFAA